MLQIGICDDDSRMLSVYENAVRESLERCGCAGRVSRRVGGCMTAAV